MSDARRLVDWLWSYGNVLRDDGVGTIEYTEQLTYLLGVDPVPWTPWSWAVASEEGVHVGHP